MYLPAKNAMYIPHTVMTRRLARHVLHMLPLALLLYSCGSDSSRNTRVQSPDSAVAHFERRLLDADSVQVDFSITSSGAVVSVFKGSLTAVRRDVLRFDALGAFMGADARIRLRSGQGRLVLDDDTMQAPPALRESVLLGLVRMGLLHNIAMMVAGKPPEHADGNFRSWVRLDSLNYLQDDENSIAFSIRVAGQTMGSGILVFDADGVLAGRSQTVHFDEGDMQVTESFTRFRIFD